MKTTTYSVAQALLMTLVTGLQSNSDRLSDGDLYLRKQITGGGIINLVDANTKIVVGESNFDGNKLPAGINMVMERIRVAYATDLTSSTDGPAAQTYTTKYSSVPDALANADFIISQNGTRLLRLPVQRFLTNDGTQGLQGVEDALFLDTLRHLKPQQNLEIQIEFANGLTLPSGSKHFIELHIIGPMSELRG